MVKRLKLTFVTAALALIATALLPSNALAYSPAYTFYGAGSSAMFNNFALVAGINNTWPGNNSVCGQHRWSRKYAAGAHGAQLVDSRSASILPEGANIWVVWDDDFVNQVAGSGHLCAYLSVDSIVGNRAFFANATIHMVSPANDTDGAFIAGFTPTENLPAAVITALEGKKINVAMTDIRPEDAKFATIRALTGYGLRIPRYLHTGLGYGVGAPPPGNVVGTPIYSSQSSTQANPVDFAIDPSDADPFTGATPRNYLVWSIGASPVMVVINTSNTAAGHLGDGSYTNIGHEALAYALNGTYTHIRQLSNTAYVDFSGTIHSPEANVPLNVFQREPLSGTFNTMEFCVTLTRAQYPTYEGPSTYGQETGVVPANQSHCTVGPCYGVGLENGNPFNHIATNGAIRARAIGTGEMVTAVAGHADSLGYSFWGFSNFAGKTGIKYMTVDGVDPLFATPTDNTQGAYTFPYCTGASYAPPCPAIPFTHIDDGTYPIWSVLRAVYDPSDSTLILPALINYAQHAAVYTYADFVPATSLTVFRSHYNQIVVTSNSNDATPNNGYKTGTKETGGDVGGAVMTIQSELDYIADTGGSQQVNIFN